MVVPWFDNVDERIELDKLISSASLVWGIVSRRRSDTGRYGIVPDCPGMNAATCPAWNVPGNGAATVPCRYVRRYVRVWPCNISAKLETWWQATCINLLKTLQHDTVDRARGPCTYV